MKGTEGRKPWSLEMQIPHISVHLLAPVESESTVALIVNRMNGRLVSDYSPILILFRVIGVFQQSSEPKVWLHFVNASSYKVCHCCLRIASLVKVSMSSEWQYQVP